MKDAEVDLIIIFFCPREFDQGSNDAFQLKLLKEMIWKMIRHEKHPYLCS